MEHNFSERHIVNLRIWCDVIDRRLQVEPKVKAASLDHTINVSLSNTRLRLAGKKNGVDNGIEIVIGLIVLVLLQFLVLGRLVFWRRST